MLINYNVLYTYSVTPGHTIVPSEIVVVESEAAGLPNWKLAYVATHADQSKGRAKLVGRLDDHSNSPDRI